MIVADAGPLIALARIGPLELLRRICGEVLVPSAVLDELALRSGRLGAVVLRRKKLDSIDGLPLQVV